MRPTAAVSGKYNPRSNSLTEARVMTKIARNKYFQNTLTRQSAPLNCQPLVRHGYFAPAYAPSLALPCCSPSITVHQPTC